MKKYVYQPEARMGDFEKCVEILSQEHRVIPEWVNNLLPEVLDRVQEGFDQQGIPVRALYVDPEIYRQYFKRTGYTERYPDYYRDYLSEKSFEHFVALRLLEIKPTQRRLLLILLARAAPFLKSTNGSRGAKAGANHVFTRNPR